jgi:hypothetical protein
MDFAVVLAPSSRKRRVFRLRRHKVGPSGHSLRFAIPTVADGRVYVGAKYEVDVYGLLPAYKK